MMALRTYTPADWPDYERERMLREADALSDDLRTVETIDDILRRSVWAQDEREAKANRSGRVLRRAGMIALIAAVAVYGFAITAKALATAEIDAAWAQEARGSGYVTTCGRC